MRQNLNRLWYVGYALQLVLWLTCKQSSEVMTMRGHLDWHASSKGKKYLSASIKFVFDLIGGRVLELDFPSPLGGLGKKTNGKLCEMNTVITLSGPQKRQRSQISLAHTHSPWRPGMSNRAWKNKHSMPHSTTTVGFILLFIILRK